MGLPAATHTRATVSDEVAQYVSEHGGETARSRPMRAARVCSKLAVVLRLQPALG